MRQKHWLILSLACLSAASCGHKGPKVTACLVSAPLKGCDCYDERTGKSFFLTLEQCDKYIALPPADAQTLLNYCAAKK